MIFEASTPHPHPIIRLHPQFHEPLYPNPDSHNRLDPKSCEPQTRKPGTIIRLNPKFHEPLTPNLFQINRLNPKSCEPQPENLRPTNFRTLNPIDLKPHTQNACPWKPARAPQHTFFIPEPSHKPQTVIPTLNHNVGEGVC